MDALGKEQLEIALGISDLGLDNGVLVGWGFLVGASQVVLGHGDAVLGFLGFALGRNFEAKDGFAEEGVCGCHVGCV